MTITLLMTAQRCRRGDDRGALLIEAAIVLPLVIMLAVGTISGGILLNRQLALTHAAREAARYGAAVPVTQCTGSPNPCGDRTWAEFVADLAVERSQGELSVGDVCVTLIDDADTVLSSTRPGGLSCYDDGIDAGQRVQVRVERPDQSIEVVFFRVGPMTLASDATARHEG